VHNPSPAASACWLAELNLYSFRNYTALTLETDTRPVVITGPNGTGKTNILESISILGTSKGLRRAKIPDMRRFQERQSPWAVHGRLHYSDTDSHTVVAAQDPETLTKRKTLVNGTVTNQTDLFQWLTVLWLTPFMDQIFMESAAPKRKFLDRLISALFPHHQTHTAKLEYALRERSKLLRDQVTDDVWYRVLEDRIARESVVIINTRQAYLRELNAELQSRQTPFPIPLCTLTGQIETWLDQSPALAVEEKICRYLRDHRAEDLLNRTNSMGGHQSVLCVNHLDFNRPAEVCSTGEQKALLVSLLLAHARLAQAKKHRMPIVLLDEVVAHLDQSKREKLFNEIVDLKMQTWLTGTDEALFEALAGNAQFFTTTPQS